MKTKPITVVLVISLLSSIVSCSTKKERVGYFLSQEKFEQIKVDYTSEQDLLNTLGEPTTKSIFAPKIYFYMEGQYEQIAFFKPRLKQQNIIAYEFDLKNVVRKVHLYDVTDTTFLYYDNSSTTLSGNKIEIWSQLSGNIKKFHSRMEKNTTYLKSQY